MITAAFGAGYTVAPQLLTEPYSWPFLHLGLCLITVIIASMGVFFISGVGADKFANYMAKRTGVRNPEVQALNLIPPTVLGFVGCILFGLSGDNPNKYPVRATPTFLMPSSSHVGLLEKTNADTSLHSGPCSCLDLGSSLMDSSRQALLASCMCWKAIHIWPVRRSSTFPASGVLLRFV
jgi:hypothetical protein